MQRRTFLIRTAGSLAAASLAGLPCRPARAARQNDKVKRVVDGGCAWVGHTQSRLGNWSANNGQYPTAMTALAGMALLGEGSTTTQGKYAANLRKAVDYLVSRSRSNGLIGDPTRDDRYTYGHGYSTMFLSQVLGEEEDEARRKELIEILTRAIKFTANAQTTGGGWGYVSARDGSDFDEGSTTITQVQALRGCRNAGIPVPKEIIDKAIKYIQRCTGSDGGVQYSLKTGGGGRPPITAAAIACLFNAGEYDSEYVPKMMKYCDRYFENVGNDSDGHWHYAHYYYSQVVYREGEKKWEGYRDKLYSRLVGEATSDGKHSYWTQGYIGPIYTTSVNLTMLQLENGYLPLYQR
jgi:hypothetical protein